MSFLLKHLLGGGNPVASGGLLLMLVGSIGALLRSIPERLWLFTLREVTMTITVKDEDASFEWVKEWFLEQRFVSRVRQVNLDTTLQGMEVALVPAPGSHWFTWHRRPFQVRLDRTESTKFRPHKQVEAFIFRTVGRDRKLLEEFVEDIGSCHRKRQALFSGLYVFDDYWMRFQAYSPRLLDSIILPPGDKEALLQDLKSFRASRHRYRDLGVPYHRGYLFHGPPGTGKTSLVSALASTFGMSIYALNLTEMTDRTLKTAILGVPENSLILFEDIDCMHVGNLRGRDTEPQIASASAAKAVKAGVTLSGLLNVLDGFHAPENVVYVMTTNDLQRLDPALLRPGRIDYRLFMGVAVLEQKAALHQRFFNEATALESELFANRHQGKTMAEFQGLLLRLEQQRLGETTVMQSAARDFSLSK